MEDMRVAAKLKKTLWGKDFKSILEEISVNGTTWKYVPKRWTDSMEIWELGYRERAGLLVRSEYDTAYKSKTFNCEISMAQNHGGVVVSGQPGIGVHPFQFVV